MKKTLTLIAMIALTAGVAIAQPRAVGARVGYNFEASYQHELITGMLEARFKYDDYEKIFGD